MAYPPREVTAKLGISPATLRRWAVEFRDLLSGDAAQSLLPGGAPLHRSYSEHDLYTLARVKELRGQGLGYDAIRERLSEEVSEGDGAMVVEDQQPAELVLSEQARLMIATQQQALAERERTIEALTGHVGTLQEQLDREQARADHAEAEARELRRHMLAQARQPEPERPARRWWKFWRRDE